MQNKHFIQLDGLRFFAVLMVMVGHWLQWTWTHPVLTKLPLVHGVTLFFVLSGFLITRILLINRDACIRNNTSFLKVLKSFYVRRVLRIFPVYFLLVFFLFAIDYKNTRELFPWIVSFTTNIYQSIHNVYVGDYNHFWSLGVEEQFYLFWPVVILFVKPKYSVYVILGTILLALVYKFYLFLYVGKWMATSYSTLSCMHALGIGALAAYITLYKGRLREQLVKLPWLVSALGIYVVMLFIQHVYAIDWYIVIGDEFLFAVLSALIILKATQQGFRGVVKKVLENKFVVYSGKVSYGMYLFHLFVPTFIESIGIRLPEDNLIAITSFGVTFVLAHLSWRYIEQPINKFKSRFSYTEEK